MTKIGYQIIFKEELNTEDDLGSQNIYPTKKDAWSEVISDCTDDNDIIYMLDKVANGEIYLKKVIYWSLR